MRRKESALPFFIVLFGFSLLIILFGSLGIFSGAISILNKAVVGPKLAVVSLFTPKSLQNKRIVELTTENANLTKSLSNLNELTSENKALKDQFALTSPSSKNLIPAKIVGFPGFIPGVSLPEYLIIDKGKNQNTNKGDTVVVGNNLVGRVVESYDDFSKIELVTNEASSFTAKIADANEVTGIIKGKGNNEILLDNVLLTKNLKKDVNVVTKGDNNAHGIGYPPDLIVGKIISVEKKSSDLFQRANVRSFLDFPNLSYVFILK